jgi:hypothetical protein
MVITRVYIPRFPTDKISLIIWLPHSGRPAGRRLYKADLRFSIEQDYFTYPAAKISGLT